MSNLKYKQFKAGFFITLITIIVAGFGIILYFNQSPQLQASSVTSTSTYQLVGDDHYFQPKTYRTTEASVIHDVAYYQGKKLKHVRLLDPDNTKVKPITSYNEKLTIKTHANGQKTYVLYHHFHNNKQDY